MDKLNRAQAQALFEEKAILIGGGDAIPEETVVELFGEAAVAHAHTLDKAGGNYCNAYEVGDYTAPYLTVSGFLRAVTYHNIRKLETERESVGGDNETFTQDDYNGLVYALYEQYLDGLEDKDNEDNAEGLRVKARYAEINGVDEDSPAAIAYLFFWAGVGKGIETATKIMGAGA